MQGREHNNGRLMGQLPGSVLPTVQANTGQPYHFAFGIPSLIPPVLANLPLQRSYIAAYS